MNTSLLLLNLKKLNIELTDAQVQKLSLFSSLLKETNAIMNLTAITDDDGIAVKHFADSLTLLTSYDFQKGDRVLDLGTGGGFPGVPLLIARSDIDLTMMDSTGKKLAFVSSALSALSLSGKVCHARAEEKGRDENYREKFDCVVSRAVAALNVLSEYCLPFVKVGGKFLALKGSGAAQEIENAHAAIEILGGKIIETKKIILNDNIERNIVVIEKVKATPAKYPRQGGKIAKNPL